MTQIDTAAEFTAGQQACSREVGPIGLTDVVRYQGASHDFNPVHHDQELAGSAGFPSPIIPGMMAMGFLGDLLVDTFGLENLLAFDAKFVSVMFLGDRLRCGAVVKTIEGASPPVLILSVTCETERGPTIQGTARVRIPSDH